MNLKNASSALANLRFHSAPKTLSRNSNFPLPRRVNLTTLVGPTKEKKLLSKTISDGPRRTLIQLKLPKPPFSLTLLSQHQH